MTLTVLPSLCHFVCVWCRASLFIAEQHSLCFIKNISNVRGFSFEFRLKKLALIADSFIVRFSLRIDPRSTNQHQHNKHRICSILDMKDIFNSLYSRALLSNMSSRMLQISNLRKSPLLPISRFPCMRWWQHVLMQAHVISFIARLCLSIIPHFRNFIHSN